jgi:hypothetical protein
MNMKLIAAMWLLSIGMSSCSIYSTTFVPNTMEAARCKKDCAVSYQSCNLANCEARLFTCQDYCMDIDRIATDAKKKGWW